MIRRVLSWIDALFAPAKDPREGPPSAWRRREELAARVLNARERIETARTELEHGMESGRGRISGLKDEARRLLQDGREDVARFVLRRRQAEIEHLRFLEEQVAHVDKDAQTLAVVEHKLRTEVAAFAVHQDAAAARFDAAEARVRVIEALSGMSDEFASVSESLEAADVRAEYMRARADAIDELVGLGVISYSGVGPVNGFQVEDGDLDEEVETALRQIKRGVDV